jgi:hypothetical protein
LCDNIPNSHYQLRKNESQWWEERETIGVMRRTFFFQLIVECVHNSSIVRGSVNKELWPKLTRVMNERTNRVWTAGQISSKYGRLRTDHKEFSELLNDESGFGWDPTTNTISGTVTQWEHVKMVYSSPY